MKIIDVLRGSKELKRLIINRSFEFRIPLKYICKEVGVDYISFMQSYINSETMANCSLTEENFEQILKLLGVSIRTQFVIDSKYDGLEQGIELTKKYG